MLSSEEVSDIVEKHIEDVIAQQPSLIEKNLKLEGRQVATDEGRIDLLFKDINGNKIVVELKLGKIGRKAVKQIKRYIKWVEQNTPEKVHGIIVCEGVMPAFEDDLKKIKDIKIYCYGWQLNIIPWSKMR